MKFEVGDTVRLKNGAQPQRVMDVGMYGNVIRTTYLSAIGYGGDFASQRRCRPASDYVFYTGPVTEEEKQMTTELYQTKHDPAQFGTFLAKNSKGQIVLEMKGAGGTVKAFNPDEIEVVMPYTVNLQPLDKSRASMSVTSAIGEVDIGDVLMELDTGEIYRVTKLDTKARSPKPNKSKWMKIPMVEITFGDK